MYFLSIQRKTFTPDINSPPFIFHLLLMFSLDGNYVISAYFSLVSLAIIVAKAVPGLHQFLRYGKVSLESSKHEPQSNLAKLVAMLAEVTVPKNWFTHFYVVFSFLQWGQLVLVPGENFNSNYLIVWLLLTIQATRRLFESFVLTNWGSTSRIHVSHYLVGNLFYVGVSLVCYLGLSEDVGPESGFLRFGWLEAALVVIFGVFSIDQFQNHRHLALLVKYSLPSFRLFNLVSCAHYLDEIAIYLVVALEIIARGRAAKTKFAFLAAWMFVAVNLTVSALETKSYYGLKFDDYHVNFAIIPFVV